MRTKPRLNNFYASLLEHTELVVNSLESLIIFGCSGWSSDCSSWSILTGGIGYPASLLMTCLPNLYNTLNVEKSIYYNIRREQEIVVILVGSR